MSAISSASGPFPTIDAARRRIPLALKLAFALVGLVTLVLLSNGAVNLWLNYEEAKRTAVRVQQEKAQAAAERVDAFISDVENQIGWTTRVEWRRLMLQQQRYDFIRLLRQAPAITEVSYLDPTGKEQLNVSRAEPDKIGGGKDFSAEPRFLRAVADKVWFGPVYFRSGSEPYMTVAIAHAGRNPGVTTAEVNLKLVWDVVTAIRVGETGLAFVTTAAGRLIAHPDLSLVLRDTDLSRLDQVARALPSANQPSPGPASQATPTSEITTNLEGRSVLTAHAPISRVSWLVFVESPVSEAMAPVYTALTQSLMLLGLGLLLATTVGTFLARRMVVPIQRLQEGAERLGGGDLSERITIRTGDELERLADRFNLMAEQLGESYASLETKVEDRTRRLSDTLDELRRLGEVGREVGSTLDLGRVLDTIVAGTRGLGKADACLAFRYRKPGTFSLWRAVGIDANARDRLAAIRLGSDVGAMTEVVATREIIQIPDLTARPATPLRDVVLETGFGAALILPLVSADRTFGTLVVLWRRARPFSSSTIDTLQTFASQSALAIQNARLFAEIDAKSRELEIASLHKSQFLANMSHELRTPLNAVLGFTEMMTDGLYGPLPEKAMRALDRVQANGRHLLGLINDVLDLSKIEAGQLVIAREPYACAEIIGIVVSSTEALAKAKGLELMASVSPGLPTGLGDGRRLTQVILNLVGNAIKFTETGSVEVRGGLGPDGGFEIAVEDTGPGIPAQDIDRIFDEFQQVDSSSTRNKGGTGLGLSISRRLVTLHGGTITVRSELGRGSTFTVRLPTVAAEHLEAAE